GGAARAGPPPRPRRRRRHDRRDRRRRGPRPARRRRRVRHGAGARARRQVGSLRDAVKPEERKTLVRNRKARHDYAIEDTLEAGIVLLGSEVKSLREGAASLVDAFAEVRGGELWLLNADISKYPWANQFNHEPRRDRKLLAKRQEIRRLDTKVREKGFTLVPLEIYLKNG